MTIYSDNSDQEKLKKKVKAEEIQNNFSAATEEEDVFAVTFNVSDRVSEF